MERVRSAGENRKAGDFVRLSAGTYTVTGA